MACSPTPQIAAKLRVLRSVLLTPVSDLPGLAGGADAVIIDARVESARAAVVEFLRGRDRDAGQILVQVSADESLADEELDSVMAGAPDGIAVAGFADGGSIALLGARIAAREAINGTPDGSTVVFAIISNGAALTQVHTLPSAGARLLALGWDAEALAADIGAAAAREHEALIEPLSVARSMCLAAAAAAGVPAIDTAMPAIATNTDLMGEAESARRHGFRGKFARRPDEVRILNEIFAGQAGWPTAKP